MSLLRFPLYASKGRPTGHFC